METKTDSKINLYILNGLVYGQACTNCKRFAVTKKLFQSYQKLPLKMLTNTLN